MNELQFAYNPHVGWAGTCMIDPDGKVYPCQPCDHNKVAYMYADMSAWYACRVGWVRIGMRYVETQRELTYAQADAITALYSLAMQGKILLGSMHNCLLRLLAGDIGEFYESEDIYDERLA